MNRTLRYAIALSIALHGVLLFGLSVDRRAAMREVPPPPLEARLVEPPAPPAPEPSPPPPPPPKVEPVKPPPPVVKPVPRPKPAPVTKPVPEPVTQPEPPAPQPEPPAPQPPAPPIVSRVEPVPAAPATPAAPSAEQAEAVTREQYRLQILDVARGHNTYPPLARENNWEGEVLVRMEIAADGRVSLAVEKSSGHPILDRQAMEMFKRAQAQVRLPASLRGKVLSFELRAIYNLKDQVSG
jgi:protein TonB